MDEINKLAGAGLAIWFSLLLFVRILSANNNFKEIEWLLRRNHNLKTRSLKHQAHEKNGKAHDH